MGLRPDAPRAHSNKVGWCDLTVNRKPRAKEGRGDTTEVTDIISPGNEDAFTVGERTRISDVSELPPFHRQVIEGPFAATVATYDFKGKARYDMVGRGRDPHLPEHQARASKVERTSPNIGRSPCRP